ncbi:MAG: SDR family oxidoreductase [Rhodospirillaceae bacterium]|nr:SDR family oxidoreductase [Rhodospirillaceae bacterium]MBT5242496.1 SDR family oxidoreductase [Rhodospirillaceae bacterium]MBT5566451.1 SDR family oxidoreductase [Rhodospirillaceae bacterium]MBT6088295.1 SDR family oxidoreductase [Rhodospirillaceae bacterium]MBT6962288.1 SDR family oxidoreductase [Rhodospirillaceae bacterium]
MATAILFSWTLAVEALAADVLIFGATRNTGLETAKILVERGDSVAAFVRETSDVTALKGLSVTLVTGDALDAPSVSAAFVGRSYDAVVSTLSGSVRNTAVDSQGNINVFMAAEKAGVKRLVLVTAIGAGGTDGVLQEGARRFLKPVFDAKTQAENDLMARDLKWTILRPGQLPEGPATGKGLLSEDQNLMGRITMGELAALIVKALNDDTTIGKIYHTVDSDMTGSFSSFD